MILATYKNTGFVTFFEATGDAAEALEVDGAAAVYAAAVDTAEGETGTAGMELDISIPTENFESSDSDSEPDVKKSKSAAPRYWALCMKDRDFTKEPESNVFSRRHSKSDLESDGTESDESDSESDECRSEGESDEDDAYNEP